MKRIGIAVLAAAAALFAVQSPASARAPVPTPDIPTDPAMRAAMSRDLGLDDAGVTARLRLDATAATTEQRLRAVLGDAFAGAWIPERGTRLTVAVTDPAAAPAVRRAGADVTVVKRGAAELDAAKRALDENAKDAGPAVREWYVDPAANAVVVRVDPAAVAGAQGFAAKAGVADKVKVVIEAAPARPAADLRGGDLIWFSRDDTLWSGCSAGLPVIGGMLAAGHCGGVGRRVLGPNSVDLGTVEAANFGPNDYNFTRTNGNWYAGPWINNYAGGVSTIAGSRTASIGASDCRSGKTTGWRCGTVTAQNVTVQYQDVTFTVTGLTRTSSCSEPGDSGGSHVSGDQAQGMHSGGSVRTCGDANDYSYLQPVNPVLGKLGTHLVTTQSGPITTIVSNWHNRCVDVPNGNFADRQQLIVWDCWNGPMQRFEWATDRSLRIGGKCLDVDGGSTAAGAKVQLYECNGTGAQQWVLSGAGDLVNPQANKCVDIKDWVPDNGAVLQLWDCTGGAVQKWRRG
ncbi:ricin-type beta-trefoil lectin domain protein [Virgisporangium aliadipatigenens]|nr:ricin-type beta-trefoil lectin domain protein [Virgisporangium aliadipatigenens]